VTTEVQVNPASFRDPAGAVLHMDGRVLRGLTERGKRDFNEALESGVIGKLTDAGLMPKTTVVKPSELPAELTDKYAAVLEHEPVRNISWPSEWTTSMLADAGLLTLKVQSMLLSEGFSLKDATAYNVAFKGTQPVFLDVGSIVRPARLNVWYALGQYQRMFLYPLYLARKGFTPGDVFLQHMDGVQPADAARILGRSGWFRPSLLFTVYLPAWLARRGQSGERTASGDGKPKGNPEVQQTVLRANMRRLEKLRKKLKPSGHWIGYEKDNTYDDTATAAKMKAVESFGQSLNSGTCLDLGANTGAYSRALSETGCRIIAVESDHGAADVLYRRLVEDKVRNVEVMRVNLANPTPGIGYMNRERASFMERAGADGAVALALVHHLMVTAGLTVSQVAELLCSLAPRVLVEYVPPTDDMFKRLKRGREDLWKNLTEHSFKQAFEKQGYKQTNKTNLPRTDRALLEFKRDG
jgi:hypothetical protein